METIGWVGLGNMGLPMAQRILAAGHPLWVWARNPQQALDLKRQGARVATDLIELAQRARIVFTMLRDTADVDEVYAGMRIGMQPDTLFIDMTTAAPAVAQRVAALTAERSAGFLDAPVTGSVADAREGRLACFVGGDEHLLEACRPVLSQLADHVVHCGATSAGYRMKLVNQTVLAGIFLGLADGLALARRDAFPPSLVLEAVGSGPAAGALFHTYAGRMLQGSDDRSFTLGLLRKDLRLAQAEAVESGASSTLLDLILERLTAAAERFGPHAGVHVLSRMDL
ncbi:NAD(P)-dependent oxidoreductase [Alcaligenaceae bacterium]|nr:NAD(P)-dependent oxidoreductase [Alcaligenaceae bacterium]